VIDAAKDVRQSLANSPEVWLGVAVDREYLRQERHLTELMNTIVSANFEGIVFRVFHNQVPPVNDARLLEGIREVVDSSWNAGIKIFLPNSGWLGWLAMAWGAEGFSGGLSKSSWFDRWPAPMNNPPKHDKIFESMLITHVRVTVLPDLESQPGYVECTCPACTAMGGEFDEGLARRHQIWAAHREGSLLAPLDRNGRHGRIKSRVEEAINFRDELPLTTRQRVASAFLDTWQALL
jgi:hypothetical protein